MRLIKLRLPHINLNRRIIVLALYVIGISSITPFRITSIKFSSQSKPLNLAQPTLNILIFTNIILHFYIYFIPSPQPTNQTTAASDS